MSKETAENSLARERSYIWIIKGIAVIAIVSCHCLTVTMEYGNVNAISTGFYELWQGLGVPVFFFLAGYLFHRNVGFLGFWKRKLSTLFAPWVVTGSIVYLYIVLRKGGASVPGWLLYLIGSNTYLYFLTNLVFFFLLGWIVKNRKLSGLLALVLYIVHLIFPALSDIRLIGIPFHFVGMCLFLFGYFVQEKPFRLENRVLRSFVTIIITALYFGLGIAGRYGISVPVLSSLHIPIGVAMILLLSEVVYRGGGKTILERLGKYSFAIYLLHMPFAGIIANLFNRHVVFVFFTWARPLVVVGLTMCAISLFKKFIPQKYYYLIGIR